MTRRLLLAAQVLGLVSPQDAETAYTSYTDAERATIESLRAKAIVGTAEQVAARLRALSEKFALDEVVINTWTHDPSARHQSYELLAHEFGLAGAS